MSTLALDMAKKTGWSHTSGDSGVEEFTGDIGQRLAQFSLWLRKMADEYAIDRIVYEKAHHRGYHATHQGHAMIGVLEWACHELGIAAPEGFHSGTIKKHATGKGKATKGEMAVAALKRNPNRKYVSDDEVDALWLLDLALSE